MIATASAAPPVEPAMEDAACPLGCAAADRPVLAGRDRFLGRPERFQVVECGGCGLLRTNPRPTQDAMAIYYGAGYRPYLSSRPHARMGAALADRVLLAEAVPPGPPGRPGRMLEVGCASGSFLARMARRGWQVMGIERSEEVARAAAALGFPVHAGPLETAPDGFRDLDLIAGWMVLEHLHDPVGGLAKLYAWTRPGGWLALSVPNAACYERRLFGDAWFALQLPTHLYHFTPATLRRMLAATGWRVRRLSCQRTLSDLVGSAGIALADRRLLPALASRLASYPWWSGRFNLAMLPLSWPMALLGQTGRLLVWAQREGSADEAARLYLDLLKRCLTRLAFPDSYRPLFMPEMPVGRIQSRLLPLLSRLRCGLYRRVPVDPARRAAGGDWPAEAETMVGLARLDMLEEAVRTLLAEQVPGDLIEAGTWRGGAAIMMRAVLRAYGDRSRRVWVADSFAGLPKPDGRHAADAGRSHWRGNAVLAVPLAEVQQNFARYGLLDEQVRFLPGWFKDTLPQAPIERLALLRLDGDLYASTMDTLESLYPRLSPGGFVLVDDYGALRECRQAVEDYRRRHGIETPLQVIDWTGVYWRKGD
jgi:O-methyltransferase